MAIAIGCNFDFAQEDELAQADIVIDDLLELKGYCLLCRDYKMCAVFANSYISYSTEEICLKIILTLVIFPVLWGDRSEKVFIAVHGNMSNKEDTVIQN